jgi:acyl dehydratase
MLTPVTVVFDAPAMRAYGGTGAHIHSDEALAREWGFPGIVAWGTLTVHPFSTLMEAAFGSDWLIGGSLDVRLRRPVCAGDAVTYSGRESDEGDSDPTARVFELEATSPRNGIVATARATVRRDPNPITT